MRLQENNLIMEQYASIHEKKKLPKGFVPFKKGHGKKKEKEDDKKDSKGKKKNPFASLKKESADIYATMSEAPMTADDQQLQADAGIERAKPSAEEVDLLNSVAPTIGMSIEDLWGYYLDCKEELASDEQSAGDPSTNETLADFLKSQNDMGVFDDMRRDFQSSKNENMDHHQDDESDEEFDRKALAHAAILDKAIDDALLLAAESWIEDSGSEENPRNIVDDIRTQCCASFEGIGWLIDTATTFASNAFGFPYDRSEMEIWVTDTTC